MFEIYRLDVRSGQGIKSSLTMFIYLTKCHTHLYIIYVHAYNLFLSLIMHCEGNRDCEIYLLIQNLKLQTFFIKPNYDITTINDPC